MVRHGDAVVRPRWPTGPARVRAGALALSLVVHGGALLALALVTSHLPSAGSVDVVPVSLLYESEAAASPASAPAPTGPEVQHRAPRPARTSPTVVASRAAPRRAVPEAGAADPVREGVIAAAPRAQTAPEAVVDRREEVQDRVVPGSGAGDVGTANDGPDAGAGGARGVDVSSRGDGAGGGASGRTDPIGAYLREVRARLQARLLFPEAARALGLRGTVTLRFVIAPDGGVDSGSIAIEASSGSAILDRAAVDSVARSVPFPQPPAGSCTIRSPVVFALRR